MPTVYSQENIAEDSRNLSIIVILVSDIYHVYFRHLSATS